VPSHQDFGLNGDAGSTLDELNQVASQLVDALLDRCPRRVV
jgi:hypothetical protein